MTNDTSKYDAYLKNGFDPLQEMLDMQEKLQLLVHGKNKEYPKITALKTLGEICDFLMYNKVAMDDEFREIIDALPGINTDEKSRSALWKKWKANHHFIRNKTLNDLTEDELNNLRMEVIDMFHFVLNQFIALNINSKMIFNAYYAKNHENIKRAQTNY